MYVSICVCVCFITNTRIDLVLKIIYCKNTNNQKLTPCRLSHLKGVLGHASEAVVGGACSNGADTELSDLICLTELRDAFRLHHTHQA